MKISNALAGLAVRDLEAAVAWFTRPCDEAPHAGPMPEVAEWSFAGGGRL